jgi:hypothetical protein
MFSEEVADGQGYRIQKAAKKPRKRHFLTRASERFERKMKIRNGFAFLIWPENKGISAPR